MTQEQKDRAFAYMVKRQIEYMSMREHPIDSTTNSIIFAEWRGANEIIERLGLKAEWMEYWKAHVF